MGEPWSKMLAARERINAKRLAAGLPPRVFETREGIVFSDAFVDALALHGVKARCSGAHARRSLKSVRDRVSQEYNERLK